MIKNVASQKVAIYAWDGANGTVKTGDAANITAEISLDGGASAPTNDVNPTELDATDHPGIYVFDLTQAETDADLVVISPVSATGDITIRPIITTPTLLTAAPPTAAAIVDEFETQSQADPTGFHVNVKEVNGTGQTANDNGADINSILEDTGTTLPGSLSTHDGKLDAVDTVVDAIQAKTDNLPTDPADQSLIIAATNTLSGKLDTVQADLDNPSQYQADVSALAVEANVQGHADAALAAYDPPTRAEATTDKDAIITQVNANETKIDTIDTVVDAIKAVTDNLPDSGALSDLSTILADTNEIQGDLTDGGRLDLLIDAIKAKTDNLLDSWNDITVANILAGIVEGSYDLKECLRLLLAFTAGKASGGGTSSIAFRDTADTKDRIVLTVDANGDRSAVVLDVS
jgi:hypothetical protein